MRVCYFGTYRAEYSRNQIMIAGLRRNGVEVVECHERLWRGIEDRVQAASGKWSSPAFLFRVLRAYGNLLRAYRRVGDYDVLVLGYPGQLDVPLARLLSRLRGKPLVLDVFMSLHLIATERGLTRRHPFTARLIWAVEKLALTWPDLLIQDTPAYARWLQETYKLEPGRFRLVPTGADDRLFHPAQAEKDAAGRFRVLYYGTFIPNHGVPYMIEAARLLRHEPDIHFELIGDGPERERAGRLVRAYGLENVRFGGWVRREDLPRRAAAADVCLGAFGLTPQSLMTVQNKIYEGLALRCCVVTGDSETVRRVFAHKHHLWLCDRTDPASLAQALRTLKEEPTLRQALAQNGHRLFRERFTVAALGERFARHLEEVCRSPGAPGGPTA